MQIQKMLPPVVGLIAVTIFFSYWALPMIVPHSVPIIFAWIVCLLTFGMYTKVKSLSIPYPTLKGEWKRVHPLKVSWVASIFTGTLLVIFIMTPLYLLYLALSEEILEGIQMISEMNNGQNSFRDQVIEKVNSMLSGLPEGIRNFVQDQLLALTVADAGSKLSGLAMNMLSNTYIGVMEGIKNTGIFILFLFIGYEGGPVVLRAVQKYIFLKEEHGRQLFEEFTGTTQAIVFGTLVVGLCQSLINSAVLWIIGLPSWSIPAVIMVLLSPVQIFGAAIMVGTGLFLFSNGEVGSAATVIASATIVGTIDNPIKAKIIGSRTQIKPIVVFVFMVFGVIAFGGKGFILGPVTIGLAILAIKTLHVELLQILEIIGRDSAGEGEIQEITSASETTG